MPSLIIKKFSTHSFLFIVGSFIALPFLWMVTTSLKPPKLAFASPYLIPEHFHWQNYQNAWAEAPFSRYYLNSIVVAILIALIPEE